MHLNLDFIFKNQRNGGLVYEHFSRMIFSMGNITLLSLNKGTRVLRIGSSLWKKRERTSGERVLIIAQTSTKRNIMYVNWPIGSTWLTWSTKSRFPKYTVIWKGWKQRINTKSFVVLASQVGTHMQTPIKPKRQEIHLKVQRILKSNKEGI